MHTIIVVEREIYTFYWGVIRETLSNSIFYRIKWDNFTNRLTNRPLLERGSCLGISYHLLITCCILFKIYTK